MDNVLLTSQGYNLFCLLAEKQQGSGVIPTESNSHGKVGEFCSFFAGEPWMFAGVMESTQGDKDFSWCLTLIIYIAMLPMKFIGLRLTGLISFPAPPST